MTLNILVLHIIQGLAFLLLAPLILGVLRWAKARLQRRQGPTPLQVYRDLLKLLRKRPIVPESASWVFTAAPVVVFTCYASLGFLVPIFYLPEGGLSPVGDLLVLIYLLGMARLAMGLAGMDAGAPFGGIGSSRELFIHILAEPTLIFIVCTLALKWRTTDLSLIIWQHHQAELLDVYADPSLLLLLPALALVTLAEAGRLPFDNPATHLELTMFGKATHLEYAGPGLALLEWAEALRLTFFLTLLANLFGPWLLAVAGETSFWNLLMVLFYPIKLSILVLGIAFWEALQVKTRLRAVVTPALTALAITLIAAMLAVVERYML
jgi:formate hydrogenlyase subunit 4